MQQRHCNWTHSQVWFGTKLITLLLAKWFMRFQNISKIFKVSSNSVSTKRVTSKKKMACMCDLRTFLGQTHAIRGQKWKWYGPHSPMILFHISWIRLIASTLIFVWSFGTATWVVPSHCFDPGPHPVERIGFSTESKALQCLCFAQKPVLWA